MTFKTTLLPHLDTVEELRNAGLLWEEGLPGHRPGYLQPLCPSSYYADPTSENTKRLLGTSEYFRIGLLLEE